MADRNQHVLNARFNYGIGPALDASVGLQVRTWSIPRRNMDATTTSD